MSRTKPHGMHQGEWDCMELHWQHGAAWVCTQMQQSLYENKLRSHRGQCHAATSSAAAAAYSSITGATMALIAAARTAPPQAGTLSDPNLVEGTICLSEGLGMASQISTLGWLIRIRG
eukprot:355638-Chlamydomonas_euryale.AAC.5